MSKIQDLIKVEKELNIGKDDLKKKYTDKMRKMDQETRLHLDEINQNMNNRGAIIEEEVEKMTKDIKNEKVSVKVDAAKTTKAQAVIKAAFEQLVA